VSTQKRKIVSRESESSSLDRACTMLNLRILHPSLAVSRHNETSKPIMRAGCKMGDGDGTVSLLSLGSMCEEGWKRKRYNPGGGEFLG